MQLLLNARLSFALSVLSVAIPSTQAAVLGSGTVETFGAYPSEDGFGRFPFSVTSGRYSIDGWLYGLNGVFNHCHVRYPEDNPNYRPDHPGWKFTCAMFRIHPQSRKFELFAEGTSNPWGIAYNEDGEAFLSACVIDHLWHISQTGYYHRQGGPYPPHTWKIESIVQHKHQKAAYCGIHYFDSDAYPEQYRGLLYMGNIHGGCINVDRVQPRGATYFGTPEPDFLTANDAWFMPVSQKTGPDGSLYILDWYDRYHCYQDANRDPAGIDRLRGRLYRVRYQNTPRVAGFDVSHESDDQLIQRLTQRNDYFRWTAQRILIERIWAAKVHAATTTKLEQLALDVNQPRHARLHAIFTLGSARPFPLKFHQAMLADEDATIRAWGVRFAAEFATRITALGAVDTERAGGSHTLSPEIVRRLVELAADSAPAVVLQVAIAARKIPELDAARTMIEVLKNSGDDALIPRIVWQNLQPLLDDEAERVVGLVGGSSVIQTPGLQAMTPFLVNRLLALRDKPAPLAQLLELYVKNQHESGARSCLQTLAQQTQSGEITGKRLEQYRQAFRPAMASLLSDQPDSPLYLDAALLAASWRSEEGIAAVRRLFLAVDQDAPRRLQALAALVSAAPPQLLDDVAAVLGSSPRQPAGFRAQVIASMGKINDPRVGEMVLAQWSSLAADEQVKAVELLAQRAHWARQLLAAVAAEKLPASAINVNQAMRIQSLGDEELRRLLAKHWGILRNERNPDRERVVQQMRKLIRQNQGNPHQGLVVYKRLCAQCHKLHGEGHDVGPDITLNGRNSYPQLLSNVFDPSLVIGSAYQARSVVTTDGRALTGLLAEEGPEHIVLKMQGGKLERLSKAQIDEMEISKLSMMPEGVEKQLRPHEIADLFALLTLDKPPSDPTAKRLAGVYELAPRESRDTAEFASLVAEVAPGFTTAASGEGGVAILGEFRGRRGVLRTHPVSPAQPCELVSEMTVPAEGRPRLRISASHHPQGDWQLVVRAGGKTLGAERINAKTAPSGWATFEYDLSVFAGAQVKVQVENRANDWAWEFGYFSDIDVVTDPPMNTEQVGSEAAESK